jgi:hypothetical protein
MIPERFDMRGIIKYLHEKMGKLPSETNVLRFSMLLETNPTEKECREFILLLKKVRP